MPPHPLLSMPSALGSGIIDMSELVADVTFLEREQEDAEVGREKMNGILQHEAAEATRTRRESSRTPPRQSSGSSGAGPVLDVGAVPVVEIKDDDGATSTRRESKTTPRRRSSYTGPTLEIEDDDVEDKMPGFSMASMDDAQLVQLDSGDPLKTSGRIQPLNSAESVQSMLNQVLGGERVGAQRVNIHTESTTHRLSLRDKANRIVTSSKEVWMTLFGKTNIAMDVAKDLSGVVEGSIKEHALSGASAFGINVAAKRRTSALGSTFANPNADLVPFRDSKFLVIDQSHMSPAEKARLRYVMDHWPGWRIFCIMIAHGQRFESICLLIVAMHAISVGAAAALVTQETPGLWMFIFFLNMLFFLELVIRKFGTLEVNSMHDGWLMACWVSVGCLMLNAMIKFIRLFFPEFPDLYGILVAPSLLRLTRIFKVVLEALPRRSEWRMARPLHFLQGGGDFLIIFASGSLVLGFVFLTASMVLTPILGNADTTDEAVAAVLHKYMSTIPRSVLTLFEVSVGTASWGAVANPLIESEEFRFQIGGWLLLLLFIVLKLCLVNMVLSMYIAQAMKLGEDFDHEVDREFLKSCMKLASKVHQYLDLANKEKDGNVTLRDLEDARFEYPDFLGKEAEISIEDLDLLHASLDFGSDGKVPIVELMMGVLVLAGAPREIDTLHMDFRQRAFLHDVAALQNDVKIKGDRISDSLDTSLETVQGMVGNVRERRLALEKVRSDLEAVLAQEDELRAWNHRQAQMIESMNDAIRQEETMQALHTAESDLVSLKAKIGNVSRMQQLATLTTGSSCKPGHMEALRAAVREKLASEVRPWFIEEAMRIRHSS